MDHDQMRYKMKALERWENEGGQINAGGAALFAPGSMDELWNDSNCRRKSDRGRSMYETSDIKEGI